MSGFAKKTIRDIAWPGRRALVRLDLNVPLEGGRVGDETRIREAVPTLDHLAQAGASMVLMSHLGRPRGADPRLSLAPVAERLSELWGRPVRLAPDCVGESVRDLVAALQPGEALLLENTRFHPQEQDNDPAFAAELARLGDVFVNDAFGAAHRADASTEGVAHLLPAVAGLLMERELVALHGLLDDPAKPFVALIGGAKISDKIGVLRALLERVDALLVGGAMANTLLAAEGLDLGASLLEADHREQALDLKRIVLARGVKLLLPVDVVVAPSLEEAAQQRVVEVGSVPSAWAVFDIGPRTCRLFAQALSEARTIFWNGPMGVFEVPEFAHGTEEMAKALVDSGASTVVGGGDSVAALARTGLSDRITHVSTGGGASLEFLEGRTLPGVAALLNR